MIGIKPNPSWQPKSKLRQDNPQLSADWLIVLYFLIREAKYLLASINQMLWWQHVILCRSIQHQIHGLHILCQRGAVSLALIISSVRFSLLLIDRKLWKHNNVLVKFLGKPGFPWQPWLHATASEWHTYTIHVSIVSMLKNPSFSSASSSLIVVLAFT